MKKAILYSAMALATTLSLSSCGDDFLLIDPAGAVSEATLTNDQGIDFVLTGAYATLNNGSLASEWNSPAQNVNNMIYGDIMGGNANEGSQAGDQPDWNALEIFSFTASNGYLLNKWGAIYEAVKRANNVISMVNKGGDAISNPDQIIGQALFLKSLWMFDGIKVFGAAIPYVSLEDYEASVDPQVTNHTEGSTVADIYIWDKVEADLKEAINKLPETWPAGEQGRATKWMAQALLGKLYLFWSSPYNGTNGTADHWNDAKTMLEGVLNSGVDAKGQKYKLADTYAELFDAATSDWTGESIIDIQHTLSGSTIETNSPDGGYYNGFAGGTAPYPAGWAFFQPSYHYVNSMITDANGLPISDFESRQALTIMGADAPVSDLTTTTDPRLDITIGRIGVPFLDWGAAPAVSWIRQWTNGGLYLMKKNQSRHSDRGSFSLTNYAISSTKNTHIIRLADVYLMLAEIAIHQNDLATAQKYINTVRARAAKSYVKAEAGITTGTYTFQNQVDGTTATDAAANYNIGLYPEFSNTDEAWNALKRERRAELAMEGHYRFDLARWGGIGSVITNFVNFESQYLEKYKNNYDDKWICLPIPDSEIKTSEGRFVQNVNWQ